jgi:hypothetical protein
MKFVALFLLVVASYSVNAQCSAPTGLSTTNIFATTATANWNAVSGAVSYDVELKPSSSSSWTPYLTGTTGLQCIFSYGLEPTTSYDWRVRANCSSGSSSYSQAQFTTGAIGSCPPPGGLYTSSVTSSTATVNWSPVSGALGYSVIYKPTYSNTWIVATSGTNLTYVTIYSLSPATTYDWRVKTNCSLYEGSDYSATSQFTTTGATATCPGPYDVSTNGNTSGAAAIPLNTDIKGTISPKYDIDHYKFTISSGGTITVSLSTLPANYNLAVLNSSGSQIGISQNSGTKNESVSLSVAAGIYYAKVFPKGTANNATSCYTLKVQTGTASKAATAAPNMENVNPDLSINLFPNPAGNQLNVSVEGVQNKTVIKVYNLMGKLVIQQESGNTLTQLDVSKLTAGFYLVQVNDGSKTTTAKFIKK